MNMALESIDWNAIILALITVVTGYLGGNYKGNQKGQTVGYKQGKKEVEAKYTPAPSQVTDKTQTTTNAPGHISGEGVVIGEADVELVKHYGADGYKDECALSPIEKSNIPEIGIKLTTITDGKVVIGYKLDNKDIQIIGNTDMTSVNGMPKTKTMYCRFSQYSSDQWLGEHTITIYQGYVDGKTQIGADKIEYFKSNEFKVQMI